jgi:hypothetical protein
MFFSGSKRDMFPFALTTSAPVNYQRRIEEKDADSHERQGPVQLLAHYRRSGRSL